MQTCNNNKSIFYTIKHMFSSICFPSYIPFVPTSTFLLIGFFGNNILVHYVETTSRDGQKWFQREGVFESNTMPSNVNMCPL
jgi:hypothetical protein